MCVCRNMYINVALNNNLQTWICMEIIEIHILVAGSTEYLQLYGH